MPEPIPQLLTLVAVARALCVSPHTVRSWVKQQKLHPVRFSRRLIFHPDEIARFLAKASDNHALSEATFGGPNNWEDSTRRV